jgi:hypothetical protein
MDGRACRLTRRHQRTDSDLLSAIEERLRRRGGSATICDIADLVGVSPSTELARVSFRPSNRV